MKNNTLRIIGGKWRGQKLSFPAIRDIRPTPDRARETLFNWLMYDIHNAIVLDAFAGSGSLGLEALSRGATSVTFLESNIKVCSYLKQTLQRLDIGCEAAVISNTKTATWLNRPANQAFDLIFLDPPFFQHYLQPCFQLIEKHGWLKPGGMVYTEYERDLLVQGLIPNNWQCIKSNVMGEVGMALLRKA